MRPAARLEGDSRQKRARCAAEAHLHAASSVEYAAEELPRSDTQLCGVLITFWQNLTTLRSNGPKAQRGGPMVHQDIELHHVYSTSSR